MKMIVIGAGPGGLTAAIGARRHGAEVTVFESAENPNIDQSRYTNRSFNLTLNEVGRKVLGDSKAWEGGIEVIGRAIHIPGSDNVHLSKRWTGDAEVLISIPRSKMRENMASLAERAGVKVVYNTEIKNIDVNGSSVTIKNSSSSYTEAADVLVVADGIHSIADRPLRELGGAGILRTDRMRYIQAILNKDVCTKLDTQRIHFWHNKPSQTVAIGLPNGNGTIALLLISEYSDVENGGIPFANLEQTKKRLEIEFPEILKLDQNILSQVVGKQLGRFHYKSIDKYVLGRRTVVVGDAGSASPPWAGFGANTAIYSADSLIRFLSGIKDIDTALLRYQEHKLELAKLVLSYANQHGEFLNNDVDKNPDDRPIGPVLGKLVNEAQAKSNASNGVELLSF